MGTASRRSIRLRDALAYALKAAWEAPSEAAGAILGGLARWIWSAAHGASFELLPVVLGAAGGALAIYLARFLGHLWIAPSVLARVDYDTLAGAYERAVTERDGYRRRCELADEAANRVYGILCDLVDRGYSITSAAPVSTSDWEEWEKNVTEFKRLHLTLSGLLEVHEWQAIQHLYFVGPKLNPPARFKDRGAEAFGQLFSVLPKLQELQKDYEAKRRGHFVRSTPTSMVPHGPA